jgi:biotin carboxyl carrier protein
MVEKRKVVVDGKEFEVEFENIGGKWEVTVEGTSFVVETEGIPKKQVSRPKKGEARSRTGASGTVSSAIPGKVVSIQKSVGDKVSAGDVVIILEAMKMQNEIKAPLNGIIREINCEAGERVDANMPLLEIEVQK